MSSHRLCWSRLNIGVGNAFGYSTMERELVKALRRQGWVADSGAPIAVQLTPIHYFQLWRTKQNVLYTMWEFDRIPSQWRMFLEKAELVIVPCHHNQRVFQAATDTPVEVCPNGVDSARYAYHERKRGDVFTFLYVGADNVRKGTRYIADAWVMWNEKHPELAANSQLIMKMTEDDDEPGELKQITVNSFIDTRVLPLAADGKLPTLAAVYRSADCFLFPSMGEGWGMTLCEAMSTGLPCIYTPWSGPEDIADETVAFPVKHGMKRISFQDEYGVALDPVNAADPSIESIVEQMHLVYTRHDEALAKGRKASDRMKTFTWARSADIFSEILTRRYGRMVA